MNWDQVKGNWREFKGQVKQKWGKLTDDDLDVIDGKREELAGKIQSRYGYAKEQAEREFGEEGGFGSSAVSDYPHDEHFPTRPSDQPPPTGRMP